MSLGMDVSAYLPGLRAAAESRFTETFTFYRATTATDDDTLESVTTESVILADVPGRLRLRESMAQAEESGTQMVSVVRREVHVGVGAVVAMRDQFVRCTASTVDPGLVGRVFRVAAGPSLGAVSAWRYPVEEVA